MNYKEVFSSLLQGTFNTYYLYYYIFYCYIFIMVLLIILILLFHSIIFKLDLRGFFRISHSLLRMKEK